MQIIEDKWPEISKNTKLTFECFNEALKLILNNAYLQFKDKYYLQTHGLPMGGPISSIIANLVLNKIETEIITTNKHLISFYMRYVDDCLLACEPDNISFLQEKFNNFHTRLKFTREIQENDSINFLDMTIFNNINHITTCWYTKPTWSERYLNFNSCMPIKYKISVINGLVDRAIILSESKYHNKNLNKIKEALIKNNFPINFIEKYIRRRIYKINKTGTVETTTDPKKKKYVSFTYIPGITNSINNLLKTNETDIVICPKKFCTLKKEIFTKLKAPTPKETKSNLIYQIQCKGCDSSYIGQTKTYLKNRLSKHISTIRNQKQDTALAKHAIRELHSFDFERVKILDFDTNLNNRLIKEMIYIKATRHRSTTTKTH